MEAEELVLHSGDPGIQSAEIFFFATRVRSGTVGREVAHLDVEGPLDPTGTRIAIPEGLQFQSLRVSLDARATSATIAEIEVLGRSVEDPFVASRRGDADCNKFLDITDALSVFGALFLGRGFCCEAAADMDVDGTVNLTDPLGVLNYLFLNGPAPAEPFLSGCGEARSPLPCVEAVCAQE